MCVCVVEQGFLLRDLMVPEGPYLKNWVRQSRCVCLSALSVPNSYLFMCECSSSNTDTVLEAECGIFK